MPPDRDPTAEAAPPATKAGRAFLDEGRTADVNHFRWSGPATLASFAIRAIEAEAGALDAAWRRAEAALPGPGWLADDGRWQIPYARWSVRIEFYESGDGHFEPWSEGYRAVALIEPAHEVASGIEPTPAAALNALSEKLEAHRG